MGFEGADFDAIEGVSSGFVERMFDRWMSDPGSVDPSWARWFKGLERSVSGPSWRNPSWPPADDDPLVAAMDPTRATPDSGPASTPQARPTHPAAPAPSTDAI